MQDMCQTENCPIAHLSEDGMDPPETCNIINHNRSEVLWHEYLGHALECDAADVTVAYYLHVGTRSYSATGGCRNSHETFVSTFTP
jgi:hypothetical protein